LRLVGLRAVSHGNQNAVIVIETNLADPETALILGNNLFSDNLAGIVWVNGQQVQRRDALLVNELRLRRVGVGNVPFASPTAICVRLSWYRVPPR
jgi:hypothetical protein